MAVLAIATAAKYFAPILVAHHILKCFPDEQSFPGLASAPSGEKAFVLLVLGVRKVLLVSFHLYGQKEGETQLHQQRLLAAIRQKGRAKYDLFGLKFIRDVIPTKNQHPF